MARNRTSGVLLGSLGVLTVSTGLYFVLLRPAMLPEDLRFVGATGPIDAAMGQWLRIVFRTWGGFLVGFGLMLGAAGAFALTGRAQWLRWGVAAGITLSFAQFLASNLELQSDFLWYVTSVTLVAFVTAGGLLRRTNDEAADTVAGDAYEERLHHRVGTAVGASGASSAARVKRAETTSSIGAGILGAGIALLLPTRFRTYALLILGLGLVMHVWGMYDKHRLEFGGGAIRVWWAELLYWLCWVTLAALVLYLLVQRA